MSYCSKCGTELLKGNNYCQNCESYNSELLEIAGNSNTDSENESNYEQKYSAYGLSNYYIKEFTKIKKTNEIYKGKWNWAAFFFGAFWAMSKGLWLPIIIALIGSFFTGGIVGIIYWFIFAIRGNYMYYMRVEKKINIPF